MARRFILVSYDITEDKRRTQIYKTLLNYGDRVQFSVFCCQLNKRERILMTRQLKEILHHTEDQILLLDAGPISGPHPEPEMSYVGKPFQPTPRVQVV